MADVPILSLTTFLPLVGALFIFLIRGEEQNVARNAKSVALWTSIITFIVSLFILTGFDPSNPGFQMVEEVAWLPAFNIAYIKGVDGVSVWFVLASTLLTPICVMASWDAVEKRVKEFMIALLVLETMLIGMFTALDFVLFSPSRESAGPLCSDLAEHYAVEVVPGTQGYWLVKGTTRPYGSNLTQDQHMEWVVFMADLARSHGCVFSTWSFEVPSMGRRFDSESPFACLLWARPRTDVLLAGPLRARLFAWCKRGALATR